MKWPQGRVAPAEAGLPGLRADRPSGPGGTAVVALRSPGFGSREVDFSIVVPTYDRPRQLRECLQAICCLTYPLERYEVLVVDDGGSRSLEPTIRPFLDRLGIALLRQPNSGPARARNAGAAAAHGKSVAFIDDDCRPEPGWMDAIARSLRTHPDRAVGGETRNALAANIYAAASQELLHFLYGELNRDPEDALFLASNNVVFPKQRFLEIGGFDEGFPLAAAEDRELCDRWRWRGHRLVYADGAIVTHYHAMDLRAYLRQHFNYGRGAVTYNQRRRQRHTRWSSRLPPFFYWRMLRYPFRSGRRRRDAAVSGLIALAQLVETIAYVFELLSRPWLRRRSAAS